jgi:hypothetical protein
MPNAARSDGRLQTSGHVFLPDKLLERLRAIPPGHDNVVARTVGKTFRRAAVAIVIGQKIRHTIAWAVAAASSRRKVVSGVRPADTKNYGGWTPQLRICAGGVR